MIHLKLSSKVVNEETAVLLRKLEEIYMEDMPSMKDVGKNTASIWVSEPIA